MSTDRPAWRWFGFWVWVVMLVAQPVRSQVVLSEFMADNTRTLRDDYGDYSDWIELYNAGTNTVDLLDWALTDSSKNPQKWLFPSTNLPPGAHLVVFASGRDRHVAGAPLHTNFKLDAGGEYLALVQPNGTIATAFAPAYPGQLPDISYGFPFSAATNVLLAPGSVGRFLVPTNDAPAASWMAPDFSDLAWRLATNGLGYETGQSEDSGTLATDVLADNPAGYWRLGETTGTTAANAGWIEGTGNGLLVGAVVTGIPGPQPASFPGLETNNLAMQLNGTGARVEVSYTPDLNPSGPFTVEAWVKPARVGGNVACALCSMSVSGSGRRGYAFYQDYDVKTKWEFLLGNSSGYIARVSGGAVDTNRWQYLAGVYDGSAARLYVNGVLAGSSSASGFEPNTTEKFILGGRNNVNPYYYGGGIDEVSVTARALSAAEISNRYRVATNGTPTTNVFNYTSLIATSLRTSLYGINSSVYFRLPFSVTNPATINNLLLRVRYDDGFAASLNGAPVAADNAPDQLDWNAAATNRRPTADALQWRNFDLTAALGYLQPGSNLLALQGLNLNPTNADFLLQVQLEARRLQYGDEERYFTQPTPGTANTLGVSSLGPILLGDGFFPPYPGTNDLLTVTCRVMQAFAPVTNVTLNWRPMYNALRQVRMYDDGLHGDGQANDGVYGGVITNRAGTNPLYAAGDMVRWYITAADGLGRTSRWPLFPDPVASAEYNGTVIEPESVTSRLPVFHLFVNPANFSGMDSESGARGSFYYDGEFYDNIYLELRGNTTAAYAKKSHRLEFNDEHQLRHPGPGGRVGKTSLLAEYIDPAYARQHLSYWLMDQAGVPAAFHYPVRVQRNGQFYQLAFHNIVLGGELLDVLGYDRQGALYKAVGTVTTSHSSSGGFVKLLPKTNLTSTADFDAMAAGISESLSFSQRKINAFDQLNLPEIVNYLAVARWTQEGDDVWANMTVYRDTFGSGEWSVIPFDLNLSWGQLYYGDRPTVYNQILATNDYYKSHPLYGGSQVVEPARSWNRLYDVIIAVPETRQMLLRRMRTLMDGWIQPAGTGAEGLLESHVCALTNQLWEEAFLDRQLWAWPPNSGPYGWGPNLWLTNGINDLFNQFINPRRDHFFGTHCITNVAKPVGLTWQNNAGIPTRQPTNAVIVIAQVEYNPASGNQDQEYICFANANGYAVDISGWRLNGAVQHTFRPGTVIPAGSALYLSPRVAAFRARAQAPRGGMGLFVQGDYKGHLSAWGESLALADASGQRVSATNYTGNPSPAQRCLRITEIMYNPAPAPGLTNDPQQFEYLELKNISTNLTLNLAGVRLTNGVSFAFSGSSVTSLGPGQTVLVVRNPEAFVARYGTGRLIAGQFIGALDNGGETVRLEDAVGEKILEFAYDNQWYPITDGLGFSLVIVDETAPWDSWGLKASWRASGRLNGSPGLADPLPAATPAVRVNEALTHSDPASDWIELFNPATTNVDVGGWFLTDDFYTPKRYQIEPGTILPPGGYVVFPGASTFEAGADGFRLSEYGEQVYLFAADETANLTGYYHGFEFGAAPNNVTFGRYVTSQAEEEFVLQSVPTPGTNNSLPQVGPVVISEIHYHPPDPAPGVNDEQNEFIELQNITAAPVPLYGILTNEPGYGVWALTNTWRVSRAVDYVFPTNRVLGAGERLLVVGFDPLTNTTQLADFRARYDVPTNILIYGPWSGKLDNAGETVVLERPDKPDVTPTNVVVPYIRLDKVAYQPTAPWPTNADGWGGSLQRRFLAAYGNDPTNWVAALPTPGRPGTVAQPPVLTIEVLSGPPTGISFATEPGLRYLLEYKDRLEDAGWRPVYPWTSGTGTRLTLLDTNGAGVARFYRVRGEPAP